MSSLCSSLVRQLKSTNVFGGATYSQGGISPIEVAFYFDRRKRVITLRITLNQYDTYVSARTFFKVAKLIGY